MRGALLALALVATAPVLAGCGFTPLYAAPTATPGLSAIETLAPEGRTGFLLREALDDALGRNVARAPVWRLSMELSQTRTPRGRRVDSTASRYELILEANWKLVEIASGATAASGVTSTEVTFDRADQPYAAIAASQDAEARAAAELARKMQLRLADWIAGGRGN